MSKRLLILSVTLVILTAMPVVSLAAAKENVVMWIPGTFLQEYLQGKIKDFEKENPSIAVQLHSFPWSEWHSKILTSLMSGTVADVAYINDFLVPTFGDLGALAPLENVAAKEALEDWKPNAVKAVSWKGHLYSMPVLQTSCPLFYNTDMFKAAAISAPPTTWSEFESYASKLTRDTNGDGKIDQWGFNVPIASKGYVGWATWGPWLYQAGGSYLNEDSTQVVMNNEAAVRSLTFFRSLVDRFVDPNDFSQETLTNFMSGRAAVVASNTEQQFITVLRQDAPDVKFNVGPILKDATKGAHTTVAGYGMFVQSKKKAEAGEWLRFLTNKANTARFDVDYYFIPPRRSIEREVTQAIGDPMFDLAVRESIWGRTHVSHPRMTEVSDIVNSMVQSVLLRRIEVKPALDQAAEKVKVLIGAK